MKELNPILQFDYISKDSGEKYSFNFKKCSCTCKGYKYYSSKTPLPDIEHCCKHLKEWILSNQDKIENILREGGQIPTDYTPLNLVHLLNSKVKPRIPYVKALEVIRDRLYPVLDQLVLDMRIAQYNYCGSLRRLLDNDKVENDATVGDLDIIFYSYPDSNELFIDEIVKLLNPEKIKTQGDQKSAIELDGIHVDVIKIDNILHYPFRLLRATGSKGENIRLSSKSRMMGLTLNEYGLFYLSNGKRIEKVLESEKEIYEYLGEEYRRPRDRNPANLPNTIKIVKPKVLEKKSEAAILMELILNL